MHQTDLQFHHSQTRCRLACKQSAAHDHDASLHTCHLFQSERVADSSQVNNVAEIDPGHGWSHRPAAHRQACFVEFNSFAVGKHGQTPLNVELCYHCSEAGLDLMCVEPALVGLLQFFEIRILFTQKALRKYPSFLSRKNFSTDQCYGAALD